MMTAWEQTKLGDLIETQKGFAFKSGWYTDFGRPIVKVSNFTDDSVDSSGLACIPEEIASAYLKYKLKADDVVVQTVGSWPTNPASVVGKCVLVPSTVAGALLNQNAVKLSPAKNIDAKFLYYLLRGDDFKSYIISTAQGAASQAAITLEAIRAFEFMTPPLSVQQRIAGILSAYDELIENNQQRIRILEEMARSLYREWFVHFRYPGHESIPLVNSPLGQIPQEWEVKPLETVCSLITDGAHHSPASVPDGFPMASVKDMHKWGINLGTCRKISEDDYELLVRNNCKPQKNDVLIAKDGSYLKHIFVMNKDEDLVILSSIALLRPNSLIRPHYLNFFLGDPATKARMKGFVSGVAIPRIILKDFRKFLVVVPPSDIQAAWTHHADSIVATCQAFISKNQNLRRTRDLLLPRLLSGQVVLNSNILEELT